VLPCSRNCRIFPLFLVECIHIGGERAAVLRGANWRLFGAVGRSEGSRRPPEPGSEVEAGDRDRGSERIRDGVRNDTKKKRPVIAVLQIRYLSGVSFRLFFKKNILHYFSSLPSIHLLITARCAKLTSRLSATWKARRLHSPNSKKRPARLPPRPRSRRLRPR